MLLGAMAILWIGGIGFDLWRCYRMHTHHTTIRVTSDGIDITGRCEYWRGKTIDNATIGSIDVHSYGDWYEVETYFGRDQWTTLLPKIDTAEDAENLKRLIEQHLGRGDEISSPTACVVVPWSREKDWVS